MPNDNQVPSIDSIPIRDDMIRLGQLLKLASMVEDGVEAAELIRNGMVKVNGQIEERRGAQLHPGDVVSANGLAIRITRG
ncbi:MAG: RNA-binding S4 domain-containing protein [Acidobacteria bacterium]|nr:RNA-binding S4 domain-containing protein [Acidobacteriota bacterium]